MKCRVVLVTTLAARSSAVWAPSRRRERKPTCRRTSLALPQPSHRANAPSLPDFQVSSYLCTLWSAFRLTGLAPPVLSILIALRPADLSSARDAVCRFGDVLLGLSTGVWAYYLYERRLNRPDGERLADLVRWKWDKVQQQRRNRVADEEGWEEIEKELRTQGEALEGNARR